MTKVKPNPSGLTVVEVVPVSQVRYSLEDQGDFEDKVLKCLAFGASIRGMLTDSAKSKLLIGESRSPITRYGYRQALHCSRGYVVKVGTHTLLTRELLAVGESRKSVFGQVLEGFGSFGALYARFPAMRISLTGRSEDGVVLDV